MRKMPQLDHTVHRRLWRNCTALGLRAGEGWRGFLVKHRIVGRMLVATLARAWMMDGSGLARVATPSADTVPPELEFSTERLLPALGVCV